jgi:hypothetical protein
VDVEKKTGVDKGVDLDTAGVGGKVLRGAVRMEAETEVWGVDMETGVDTTLEEISAVGTGKEGLESLLTYGSLLIPFF